MQNQEKILKIEDDINELLDGELRDNAFKFVAYLNQNQLTPTNRGDRYWKIPYNGFSICMITLEPGKLYLSFFLSYFQSGCNSENNNFRICMQDNVAFCDTCHTGCTGSFDLPLFGKDFTNVCSQHTINFVILN